ncbi:unnamed protein product [Rotaria sordida]|uniref:Uncharacterized protein n=1 Tax=Rotaria sordida TaxID=392033 RepID=A0A815DW93_9BILA|nr:unnamed protein product [Rotaria sordida]CAF4152384.1 unnamed protein product [Rotaria sordida]
MDINQIHNHFSIKTDIDDDFKLINDMSKEEPIIDEHRRLRDNEITEKFDEYIRKGYSMINDTCPLCSYILLRTPARQVFCVGCNEIKIDNKRTRHKKKIVTRHKKKSHIKFSKTQKKKREHIEYVHNCNRLENKVKWAIDKLIKIQKPNRINEMCTVIIKLIETIDLLKKHEMTSITN